MDFAVTYTAEQPLQQVEEMDSNVHGKAAGSFLRPLPRRLIPATARRDVRQLDLVFAIAPLQQQLVPQRHEFRVQPELEDREDTTAGFLFEPLQGVEIPRTDDERLLADRVGAGAQGHAHVGVVKVIRGADADVVNPVLVRAPT